MGRNMRLALAFAKRNPGWHSFEDNRPTRDAITRLARRELVEVNEFKQFRAKYP